MRWCRWLRVRRRLVRSGSFMKLRVVRLLGRISFVCVVGWEFLWLIIRIVGFVEDVVILSGRSEFFFFF